MSSLIWVYGEGKIPFGDNRFFNVDCGNITFAGFKTRDDLTRVFSAAKKELADLIELPPSDIRGLANWAAHNEDDVHVLPLMNKSVKQIIMQTAASLSIPYALVVGLAVGAETENPKETFRMEKKLPPTWL